MAKTDFKSLGDYLATLAPADAEAIQKMRAAVLEGVPEAEEAISYQLPAFKYHGWICYLSVASRHYGYSCPPPFNIWTAFAEELKPYEVSTSAVRFPKNQPLPLDLITRMARFRAEENVAREGSKATRG